LILACLVVLVLLMGAATGLCGVLNYSVIRQQREIGIRMALGAPAGHVVGHVTTGILAMVCLGSNIGLAGLASCGSSKCCCMRFRPRMRPWWWLPS
jgi:putative ABC transport system permease protein